MTLAQFMLPGEAVLYESPHEVYYRRRPHALLITGERLLLHGVTGAFGPKEHVVVEPLSGILHLEYSEGGLLSTRGRLDIHFADGKLSIAGEPDAIKEVWRALQSHAAAAAPAEADDEVTLVAPVEPLFDDLPHPPARVEPLATIAPRRGAPNRRAKGALVVWVLCLAAALAAASVFLIRGRRPAGPPPQDGEAAAASPSLTATPAPTPAPVRVMDEAFTLDEGSHQAVRFTIPEPAAGARLAGGFRVTGDGYVDFYVMGEDQYGRFAAGAAPEVTSPVFRRGQWNAKVGEHLAGGTYYLVFDNPDYGTQSVAAQFFVIFE